MNTSPLRYNISSWEQLSNCLSNNSNQLHIRVANITQDDRIGGTLIDMFHDDFGSLFCYLVDASGPLVNSSDPSDSYEMTSQDVLKQLERYGFFVTFSRRAYLKSEQIDFLQSLQHLGYDKLRVLQVYTIDSYSGAKIATPHVVVFNVEPNPRWLDNMYQESSTKFLEAICSGSAIDISMVSKEETYRWDWLDYVANIQDILNDNIPSA